MEDVYGWIGLDALAIGPHAMKLVEDLIMIALSIPLPDSPITGPTTVFRHGSRWDTPIKKEHES